MSKESNTENQAITITVVQKIIEYMEENLLEDLTSGRIAEHFYMSVSALNNLFKTVCVMTIMEYVRNRRLSLAGEELLISHIPVIDMSFKYGYETPEAFTKAFTRFHGFPPSFVRRAYPRVTVFHPLKIKLEILGGWEEIKADKEPSRLTKENPGEQAERLLSCYDKPTILNRRLSMEGKKINYHISVENMQQKNDWRILLALSQELTREKIKFKVDGKTMLFAHGLEFKLEKICMTFKWNEEERVQNFFECGEKVKSSFSGFKYFDTVFQGMKIRCMFYESPDNCSDDVLFQNAEPVEVDGQIIYVQTLEFYYENAKEKDEYYRRVEQWIGKR